MIDIVAEFRDLERELLQEALEAWRADNNSDTRAEARRRIRNYVHSYILFIEEKYSEVEKGKE